jgi:hypothetical protein
LSSVLDAQGNLLSNIITKSLFLAWNTITRERKHGITTRQRRHLIILSLAEVLMIIFLRKSV